MENKYTKEDLWDFLEYMTDGYAAKEWATRQEVLLFMAFDRVDEAFKEFIKGWKCVISPPLSGEKDRSVAKIIKMLFCPLDEMPLYINKKDPFIKKLAEWRLKRGK